MALAPPGPSSLATVVNRCTRSTSRSFMAEQGRGDCFQGQDCLSYRFQATITNSPHTGARGEGPLLPGRSHGVDPCAYLVDVLQRAGLYPARDVGERAPRRWQSPFADTPSRSHLAGLEKQRLGLTDLQTD
jgi:hypothetical protein